MIKKLIITMGVAGAVVNAVNSNAFIPLNTDVASEVRMSSVSEDAVEWKFAQLTTSKGTDIVNGKWILIEFKDPLLIGLTTPYAMVISNSFDRYYTGFEQDYHELFTLLGFEHSEAQFENRPNALNQGTYYMSTPIFQKTLFASDFSSPEVLDRLENALTQNGLTTVPSTIYTMVCTNPVSIETNYTHEVNVNTNVNLVDIFTELNITDYEITNDFYTGNKRVVGEHLVTFIYKNVECTLTINVVDTDTPIITGTSRYQKTTTEELTLEEILSNLSVSDNNDDLVEIQIHEDNYTGNANKVGTYSIKVFAEDKSGNRTDHIVVVEVIDVIDPELSGTNHYTKHTNVSLSIKDIMSNLVATDNIDGNISSSITVKKDNYTGNANKVGTYDIVFAVQDFSGNEVEYTVTIDVVNSLPNVYMYDNNVIVYDNVELNNNDIVSLIKKIDNINISSSTVFKVNAEDYYNSTTAGTYEVSYTAESADGTSFEGTINIKVLSTKDLNIEEPEFSFFDNVGRFFKDIGEWFVNNWIIIVSVVAGIGAVVVGVFGFKFLKEKQKNKPKKPKNVKGSKKPIKKK